MWKNWIEDLFPQSPCFIFYFCKMLHVCPPHVVLLMFPGTLTGNPCSGPPVLLNLIRWLDAVNIPFYFYFVSVFWSLLYVLLPIEMHVTNGCFLFSKAGFCFFTVFFVFFCRFLFFPWAHDWCVPCETVLGEMCRHHPLAKLQFYIWVE